VIVVDAGVGAAAVAVAVAVADLRRPGRRADHLPDT
jgi:hypothetical protein